MAGSPVDRTVETKEDVFNELLSDYAGVSLMREQFAEAKGLNTIRNISTAQTKAQAFQKRYNKAT